MSFTTTLDQQRNARNVAYPHAQDPNFLGFNRDADRWKVDASGTWSHPSGVMVMSASGTYDLPVYLTQPIPVAVNVDIESDSIKVFSASGTPDIPVYLNAPLDYGKDSVAVMSSSGTFSVPVYMTSPVEVEVALEDHVRISSASGTPDIPVYVTEPTIPAKIDLSRIEEEHNLSTGPFDYSTNFGRKTRVKHALLHSASGLNEHVIIELDSKSGSNFDTVLASGYLCNQQSVSYFPDNDLILEEGDELKFTCTDINNPDTIISLTVLGELLN